MSFIAPMSFQFDPINNAVIPILDNLTADVIAVFIGVVLYRYLNPRSRLLAEFSKHKRPWLAAWVPAGTRPEDWVTELLTIRVSLLQQKIRFESFPIISEDGTRIDEINDTPTKYHWYANCDLMQDQGIIFGLWRSILQPGKYNGLLLLDVRLLTRLVGEFVSPVVGDIDPTRPLLVCSDLPEMIGLLKEKLPDQPALRDRLIERFRILLSGNN